MTYSFLDILCSISGPAGALALGAGSGGAEEGITVEMDEDKDTMITGADGALMHSLHSALGGRMTVRLLKAAPVNGQLSLMYMAQQASARLWGTNTITIDDRVRGDKILGVQMAFMRFPNVVYATEGGIMEWVFGGRIVQTLGFGGAVV
jgi:hypothetical protein